jgi:hypothetical protein
MSTLEAQLLKGMLNTGYTDIYFIRLSDNGDIIYVTGIFTDTLDIGNGVPSISTNSIDGSGFIASYSKNLTPISLKSLDSTDLCIGLSIALSNSGSVYVTGFFKGTLNIGNGVSPITNNSEYSGYIAEYSNINNLTPIRLKYLGGTTDTDTCGCRSIAISNSGSVYVTGDFSGTLNIGNGVSSINTDVSIGFIAEYRNMNDLTPFSLIPLGGTGFSMAVSNSDIVYVTGVGFVASYTNSLTPISLKSLDSTLGSICYSIALSDSGSVYVTGNFSGTLDIGGGVSTISTNSIDVSGFIAEYSSGLTPINLKYLGGTNDTDKCIGFSIAISNSGSVYVTGEFRGTLDIGDGVSTITTNSITGSGFIAEYSNGLIPISLKYLGSTTDTDTCIGFSIVISNSGSVYVTGEFSGTLNIGNGVIPITTNTEGSGFIAVYSTVHNEPICLVAGTPIVTDQGTIPIENIDTAIHTIGHKAIIALTKAITPEKHLICFETHSLAINCPTKRTVMTPGHEVLYRGKMVQAKNFLGKLDKVHTVPYDGKKVYNILQKQHGLMVVNNMILETLHPENKVAKDILKGF